MTTYPHHGVHVRRPRPNVLLLVLGLVVVGVGAWLLVDHFTGGSSGISNTQAITFIQTGKGLSGLNAVNGNANAHGTALPAEQRPYAIRMYRNGPYAENALNLFYAIGATTTHFVSADEAKAIVSVGRPRLIEAGIARVTNPQWITQYGITVREAVTAAVRGMFAGAATS